MSEPSVEVLYRSERVTLYVGDCRSVLPTLGTETVDLVVTDPPYGAEWRSNARKERFDPIHGDRAEEARALLAAVSPDLVRVTRRTRHLYTFGLPLTHELLTVKADLVWDKDRIGGGDLRQAWGPSHERIYFHVRAADRCNAERESGSLTARLRRGSVIRVRRLSATQIKRHPTEKPLDLMQQLIESSSVRGELVLDPFAGSGSTLVAALLTGRRAIGVELNPKYALIAAERLAAVEMIVDQHATA